MYIDPEQPKEYFYSVLAVVVTLFFSPHIPAAEKPVLNVYNWADYIGPTTLADFEKEFGIKVNYDIYDNSEIVDTKLMAGNTGYDVVVHSAGFSARFLDKGIYQPLDKSKLPNLRYLDPLMMKKYEFFDPGNKYSVPYTWGTTGISYNVDMIKARMPDAPLDSARFFFDPEIISKFADCGVTILDSPIDVIPMAMIYLGHEANSIDPEDLKDVENLLKSIRPYIKYFSSTKMLIDMPNKEICVAMSWSGDYTVASVRAEEAGIDIHLDYIVPIEGTYGWFDSAFIPADAPHPDNAHKFINYLMRPKVIADITNFTGYANINLEANRYVDPEYLNNPAVYPDEAVLKRLHPAKIYPPKQERRRSRTWTRIKTGL